MQHSNDGNYAYVYKLWVMVDVLIFFWYNVMIVELLEKAILLSRWLLTVVL